MQGIFGVLTCESGWRLKAHKNFNIQVKFEKTWEIAENFRKTLRTLEEETKNNKLIKTIFKTCREIWCCIRTDIKKILGKLENF